MNRVLIVGAGFFGAVTAERLAVDAGIPVTVIDRRSHIGGNSWSEWDSETGVEFHKYGSHIFHTSNAEVWSYITRFTDFNQYRHSVWTTSRGKVYPIPISLATINSYYGTNLSPDQAKELIRKEAAEFTGEPANLEEKAISQIGRPLYEAFIRGYTIKQWEKSPLELSAAIISRLPVRYTYDIGYFSDPHEGIPLRGYAALFTNLLKHEKIEVRLNTSYADILAQCGGRFPGLVIYTGAIDEFFQYRLGRLDWRTLDLEWDRPNCADFQGTAVMNYADEDVPYTRIHEFKHYHPERSDTGKTLICREYPHAAKGNDEPFYPVDTQRNRELYPAYVALARAESPKIIFGGRLGGYKYIDMDATIAAALECYRNNIVPLLQSP